MGLLGIRAVNDFFKQKSDNLKKNCKKNIFNFETSQHFAPERSQAIQTRIKLQLTNNYMNDTNLLQLTNNDDTDTNLQNRSVAIEDDHNPGTKRKNEDKDKDAAPAVEKKAKTNNDENIPLIAEIPDLSVANIMKSCRTFGIDSDAFIRSLQAKTTLKTRFENIPEQQHISSVVKANEFGKFSYEEHHVVQIMNKFFAWSNEGMSIIEYTWEKNHRGDTICRKYATHLMTHLRNRLKGFVYQRKLPYDIPPSQARAGVSIPGRHGVYQITEWFVIWQKSTDRINEDMFKKKVREMGALLAEELRSPAMEDEDRRKRVRHQTQLFDLYKN